MEQHFFHYASIGIERSLPRRGKQAFLESNDLSQILGGAKPAAAAGQSFETMLNVV